MVRLIGIATGLVFVGVVLWSLLWGVVARVTEPPVETAEHAFHLDPKHVDFSYNGPIGKFDRAQLQRGFQVYKEVCSACHSIRLVAFRDLEALGYSEAAVKKIAADWLVQQPSFNPETGEAETRPSIPADNFPLVYANEAAARAAQNGALPPDLSLMAKARHHGDAYVYSLLTGYTEQPAVLLQKFPEAKTPDGLHYNPYFANLNIAMGAPLVAEGQVNYADGTPATVDQMAKDVSAFLAWTAEPKMEDRKATGIAVLVFLLIATALAWLSYRNIWASAKKPLPA